MEHVPGRINIVCSLRLLLTLIKGRHGILTTLKGHKLAGQRITGLKCDTSGSVPIILAPRPSDDPNDPLVGSDFLQPSLYYANKL
jgi:hypothetical protein